MLASGVGFLITLMIFSRSINKLSILIPQVYSIILGHYRAPFSIQEGNGDILNISSKLQTSRFSFLANFAERLICSFTEEAPLDP